jgi:hypothetical protein
LIDDNTDPKNPKGKVVKEDKEVTPGTLPKHFGGKETTATQPCANDQYKVAVFEDKANPGGWHVMRQDPGSKTWTGKNGDGPVVEGIYSPSLYYKTVYKPIGEVQSTYWCVPIKTKIPQ